MPFHIIDGNNIFRINFETYGSIRAYLFELNAYPRFDPILFVWDGYNAKARRRALYPGYKVGRARASDVFYRTMDLFKQVLPATRCMSLEIPGWEADDVIAKLHRLYAPIADAIRIHSTDGDMLALCDGRHTQIVGRENIRYENTDWTEVRLYKALVGDNADKITGLPFFGEKSWERCDRARWMQFFTEGATPDWDAEGEALGINDCRALNWLRTPGNDAALRGMWEIIGFFDVDEALITRHLVVGVPDDQKMNEILTEFMI
jgi:hypothetical protein